MFSFTEVADDIDGLVFGARNFEVQVVVCPLHDLVELGIVYSANIDAKAPAAALFAGKGKGYRLDFVVGELPAEVFDSSLEIRLIDLTLVVWVGHVLQLLDEVVPGLADVPLHLREELNGLVLVLLLMYVAVIQCIPRRLPASLLVADSGLGILRLVLPKIEAFSREHLCANRMDEVIVRYFAILINI